MTPLIEMAVPDLVTMLLPPFHMRVGHLLHERGKIAISLGPNDKGSSGVPGGWCCVVRRKLLFSDDLWRKAGHSIYRTQVTEIK